MAGRTTSVLSSPTERATLLETVTPAGGTPPLASAGAAGPRGSSSLGSLPSLESRVGSGIGTGPSSAGGGASLYHDSINSPITAHGGMPGRERSERAERRAQGGGVWRGSFGEPVSDGDAGSARDAGSPTLIAVPAVGSLDGSFVSAVAASISEHPAASGSGVAQPRGGGGADVTGPLGTGAGASGASASASASASISVAPVPGGVRVVLFAVPVAISASRVGLTDREALAELLGLDMTELHRVGGGAAWRLAPFEMPPPLGDDAASRGGADAAEAAVAALTPAAVEGAARLAAAVARVIPALAQPTQTAARLADANALLAAEVEDLHTRLRGVEAFKAAVLGTVAQLKAQVAALAEELLLGSIE